MELIGAIDNFDNIFFCKCYNNYFIEATTIFSFDDVSANEASAIAFNFRMMTFRISHTLEVFSQFD